MPKTYIIIDGRGRATLHDEREVRREITTRLGSGESYQLFEAQALEVKIDFGAASGPARIGGGKKRGRPASRKKGAARRGGTKAAKRAGKKTGKVGRPRLNVGDCTQEGCKNPSKTRGLCSAHYQKHRRLVQEGKTGLISSGVTPKKAGRPAKKKAAPKTARKAGKKAAKKAAVKKPAAKKAAKKTAAKKSVRKANKQAAPQAEAK
ncbi:MAG: hypothetical protein P1V51_15850 [Deltaproteobacteria bacterium]|nr:hypothetical protein [Deltaproteobacteria bacterium]